MIGTRTVNFSISVNWLVTIGLTAIALILLFIFKEDWRPVLLFVAPVLGGSAALIAAFNALETRGLQAEQSKKQGDQAKRAASMLFIHAWLNPTFYYAKKSGRAALKYLKEHPNLADQRSYLEEDADRLSNLLDLLNVFEAMGTAVQEDIADEVVLKRFFRSVVVEYWHSVEPFVRARRAERQNVRLSQEMEWLFKRWN